MVLHRSGITAYQEDADSRFRVSIMDSVAHYLVDLLMLIIIIDLLILFILSIIIDLLLVFAWTRLPPVLST